MHHPEMGVFRGILAIFAQSFGFGKIGSLAHVVVLQFLLESLVRSFWKHGLFLQDGKDPKGL